MDKEHVQITLRKTKEHFECPNCFVNWMEEIDYSPVVYANQNHAIEKLCHFCESDPDMPSRRLLKRRLSVLKKANINKFPEVIRHLFEYFDAELNDDKN